MKKSDTDESLKIKTKRPRTGRLSQIERSKAMTKLEEIKKQRFGIEVEMTGISRTHAARLVREYFDRGSYDDYEALDDDERAWKFVHDGSIDGGYQTEMVSPICTYEDIETVQDIVRLLKDHGAVTNNSCGIHIHVDGQKHNFKTVKNIINIIASKENYIYKALAVIPARENRYAMRMPDRLKGADFKSLEGAKKIWYGQSYYETRDLDHYDGSRYYALNLHSMWYRGTIEFRLFNGTLHAGKIKAYIQFCMAINNQALTQRGAASRATTFITNERYAMRTWLVRMGMNGNEFKTARRFLLENLNAHNERGETECVNY